MSASLIDTFPRFAPYPAVAARLAEIGQAQGAVSSIIGTDAHTFTIENSFPDAMPNMAARHLIIMADLAAVFTLAGSKGLGPTSVR
ncbi:MAG: hypothetical protein NVS3B5_17160 [Sphingomicrobium sp.]